MSAKQTVLDCAESLFNQQGYTAVGIDLIRDTAKISKTTIYRHFGGKDGLIEAVLTRRHQRFEEGLNAAVAASNEVIIKQNMNVKAASHTRLCAILEWHYHWFTSSHFEGCMFMHALSEFKQNNRKISQIALNHKAWLGQLIKDALAPSLQDIELKAEMLLTFIEGLIVRAEFAQKDVAGLIKKRPQHEALMLSILR